MTLNCMGLTQLSVIWIIHRNVGLKCFFHLNKFLLLSLVFSYIYISQGSVEMLYGVVGYITITLMQIVCRVCQWKNFENLSIIGEYVNKSKVPRFLLAHSVHTMLQQASPTDIIPLHTKLAQFNQSLQTDGREVSSF